MGNLVVADVVREIIAETCLVDVEQVLPNSLLAGFSIDSVRVLEIAVAVEEAFDIEVETDDWANIETVADLVAGVERIVNG